MHNVKETSLNIVCITVLALTSVVAVSVFDNDNLDCGVSMCLGIIVIAIGMLLSIFPKILFSDCSGCLGIKLSDIADKFCFDSKCTKQTESAVAHRGFRPSYYDSENDYDRARQKEERNIQELIRQIDQL